MDGSSNSTPESSASTPTSTFSTERTTRVNAAWEQMNKGFSGKLSNVLMPKSCPTTKKMTQKKTPDWMGSLGISPRQIQENVKSLPQKRSAEVKHGTIDEARSFTFAASSSVKGISPAGGVGLGKVKITEARDFAGEEVELNKFVASDSKMSAEKAKVSASPSSALDAVLDQIKKKPKLSVLDKTKKDWNEFKDENKGLEEQLDSHKKSSNQYLDKVSFLQRTDLREFEREKDVRLGLQPRRRTDVQENDDYSSS